MGKFPHLLEGRSMKRDRAGRGIPAAPGEPQGGRPERGEGLGGGGLAPRPAPGDGRAGPESPRPESRPRPGVGLGLRGGRRQFSWARRPSPSRKLFPRRLDRLSRPEVDPARTGGPAPAGGGTGPAAQDQLAVTLVSAESGLQGLLVFRQGIRLEGGVQL